MSSVSTSKIYVLKNSFTAAAKILSLTSGNDPSSSLSMIDARNVSPNSLWFLTPTHTSHFYRLHTIANGVQQSLDVINDNGVQSINLHLTSTGEYSGQYWRFDDWHTNPTYPYRLSNNFTGPNAHLDVYSDNLVAHLDGGDYSGQHWALVPADTVVVTTS
ncbi:carbohydrate-binding module family 13 protein [Trichoderma citrinoviride]|uniref:Carbohydrate-binding module family 13 protein n=1 Tax=Trichoderma citrinoviride TaxID=58853 RepID=A0A2T4B2G0_9HYPO|nr:carbohydrate-binding module family 13 protein [Trichoderma citrinoviride]PTB63428.1 carbohydrate-binding module family 13 protein [Trichoderma citrinoviride]